MAVNRYPQSAPNGRAIPIDIIRPEGAVIVSYSDGVPLGSLLQQDSFEELLLLFVPSDTIMLEAYSDIGVPLPDSKIYCMPNLQYIIAPRTKYLDIQGVGAAGTLYLNYITRFDTLATTLQQEQL